MLLRQATQPSPTPRAAHAAEPSLLRGESRSHEGQRPTFLWKTGLVWPPKPACFLSYRRLPVRVRQGRRRRRQHISCRLRNGLAQHGRTLLWSCVLQELRPRRLTAATVGPSSWPDWVGSSDSASKGRCSGSKGRHWPRLLGDWEARREGESERWRESCCQASTRSVQTADESFRPAQHQRLAPELARPLCLQLAGTHGNSTGSRG